MTARVPPTTTTPTPMRPTSKADNERVEKGRWPKEAATITRTTNEHNVAQQMDTHVAKHLKKSPSSNVLINYQCNASLYVKTTGRVLDDAAIVGVGFKKNEVFFL